MALKRFLGWGSSSWLLVLLLASSGAQAATLNVVGGILHGASGVDVGGSLYDVTFVDGTCIALFSGCDSASDFTFTSSSAATAASQALLDQVFIDGVSGNFDTDPALMFGLSSTAYGYAWTPFASDATYVQIVSALNHTSEGFDYPAFHGPAEFTRTYNTAAANVFVYAIWTPVPEPSSALLIAMGLAGLGWRGRAKHA